MSRGVVYIITAEQLAGMVPLHPQEAEAANLSSLLLAGYYGPDLICVLGFVPTTLISTTAYMWLTVYDQMVARHRIAFGRDSRRFIKNVLQAAPYDVVWGYCLNDRSRRWLRWLGATLDGSRFEFRRS